MGDRTRRAPDRIGRHPSSDLSPYPYRVDVGRAYSGVDQYENSARHRVLCPGDSYWIGVPPDGERYDEAGICRVEYDL